MSSKLGDIKTGVVIKVFSSFAIMLFPHDETGIIHISQLTNNYVRNFTGYVSVGNIYKVKVIQEATADSSMHVSIKALSGSERRALMKERIPDEDISFAGLSAHLDDWIKKENAEK